MKCSVVNCPNSRQYNSERISYFAFPQDPEDCEKWIAFCGRTGKFYPKAWKICMEHFKEEDIEGHLQFAMGFATKRHLKPGAIPCINKYRAPGVENDFKIKRHEEVIVEIPEQPEVKLETKNEETNSEIYKMDIRDTTPDIEILKTEVKVLQEEVKFLKQQNLILKEHQEESEKKMRYEIDELRKLLTKTVYERKRIEEKLIRILRNGKRLS